MSFRKAAVIGAGVMGSGIAAHLANAGLDVVLLDLEASLAAAGVQRQLEIGGFMLPDFADRVRTGAITDSDGLLKEADWIVEAVAERLDIKRELYRRVGTAARPDAVMSSNTSTLPLAVLAADQPRGFAERFLITHFFNPPRRMRLLEIVAGERTDASVLEAVETFCDARLGKGVVRCKDTPGFIGNRIGAYWMLAALAEAAATGVDLEAADAALGAPFGIPRSGVFGLLDLIGLDVMVAIADSLAAELPGTDPLQDVTGAVGILRAMIDEGLTGRKGGAGFYRISQDRLNRETFDLASRRYRPLRPVPPTTPEAGEDLRSILDPDGEGTRFAAAVMLRTLAYSARLVPEIADSPLDVDRAMELGYGWKRGPFTLIDNIGADWLAGKLGSTGIDVPPYLALAAKEGGFYSEASSARSYRAADGTLRSVVSVPGIVALPQIKHGAANLLSGPGFDLLDTGDGVALLDLHSKMNVLSLDLVDGIGRSLERAEESLEALVVATEGANFSAGADLKAFLAAAHRGDINAIAKQIDDGQQLVRTIRHARIPVVMAASGPALGGGCELLMHAATVVAHAELDMGLVETAVGLVPAWGGCTRLLAAQGADADPVDAALAAFNVIFNARRSQSAAHARRLGYLKPGDEIVMNIERLPAAARKAALGLVGKHRAPERTVLRLSGHAGVEALTRRLDDICGQGSHQRTIGLALIGVLTGGVDADPDTPVEESAVMALERSAFLNLVATSGTQARIEHMLSTGKPLKN